MFTVELYAKIRRAVMVDGLSRRDVAQRFGVHRNTISKMLQFSVPPGYRRRERPASKKLGPYMAWIDKVLEDDKSVHAKQRHTAHRIFERLRDEEGFSGRSTVCSKRSPLLTPRTPVAERQLRLCEVLDTPRADGTASDAHLARLDRTGPVRPASTAQKRDSAAAVRWPRGGNIAGVDGRRAL